MTEQELLQAVKDAITESMATFSAEIGKSDDRDAVWRYGAPTGLIKLHISGTTANPAKLRRSLDGLHRRGLLLKSSIPGSWSSWWPVGFADELRS